MDAFIRLFNDQNTQGYFDTLAMFCVVAGYFLAIHAVIKFAVLADGRQRHEGGMANVVATFIVAVCLVGMPRVLEIGRATLGVDQNVGIAYGNFVGWQMGAITSVMNLMRFIGVIFVIKSLFIYRQSTIEVGRGNVPRATAMLVSGIMLTNPPVILNTFGQFLPK